MSSIQGHRPIDPCIPDCGDTTPPPTPCLERAIAFRLGSPDPAYLELSNVEVGTRIELINLSKKPDASFDCDAISLPLTGRDVPGRRAAVMLDAEAMAKLDIAPGDAFALRLLDDAGNASEAVRGAFDPHVRDWDSPWAGLPAERRPGAGFRTAHLPVLEGEGVRRDVQITEVRDGRPPVIARDRLRFEPCPDGTVRLVGEGALEPGARLYRPEKREGASSTQLHLLGAADDDGQLSIDLGTLEPGARITVMPRDVFGAMGEELELVYDPAACATGSVGVPGEGLEGFPKDRLHLDTRADGGVTLCGDLLPAGSQVEIQDQTRGTSWTCPVSPSGTLLADLGRLADGTPLVLTPIDRYGARGDWFELRYACATPGTPGQSG